MEFSEDEQQSLHRLLRWRRDVRHFETRPVPEALIGRLQQAMNLAPSVGNARPWRVFRVDSVSARQQVQAIFHAANDAAAEAQTPERQAHYRRLKLAGLVEAPLQLAVFTETNPTAGHGLGRHSMPQTLEQSTAMAVQNLNLTARVHGLGVGMVSILDPQAMAKLFNVPEHWRFSLYLCIGWPKFTDDQPLLHRNGWQTNQMTPWQSA
ncbi:MAG: 5,6-dimethylbenzimidazole synthase [Lautropia sp.]|nr:5,6-dimethylbenzimidazole synthase [Lautropia sp.]